MRKGVAGRPLSDTYTPDNAYTNVKCIANLVKCNVKHPIMKHHFLFKHTHIQPIYMT